MSPWSILAALLVFGCAASPAPAPSTPAPAPEATPVSPPAASAPEPEPVAEPVATSPTSDPAPTGKACSVWSGGPMGDAPPPKGYDPNPCGDGAHCECQAQAGYSCSGVCRPN